MFGCGGRGSSAGDTGAGFTVDAVPGLFQQGNEGGAAGLGLSELHGGLYLGQHGALGKLVLLHVLVGFGGGLTWGAALIEW